MEARPVSLEGSCLGVQGCSQAAKLIPPPEEDKLEADKLLEAEPTTLELPTIGKVTRLHA